MPVRHPFQSSASFGPLSAEQAAEFDGVIDAALAEDIGPGDITTNATIDASMVSTADIVARKDGVVAGLPIAARVFSRISSKITFEPRVADGARVLPGSVLARISGPTRGLLTGERVALNFLGRLSGIASLTRRFVDAAGERAVRIADTRKTTPGLRALERYAVRAGGGANHRFGLFDAVLIKDNHIVAVGSVAEAIERAREAAPRGTIVEVECESTAQVREAVAAGADAILLDNMESGAMREAVGIARGRAIIEASGNMTLERIFDVASTGVDVISIGALTHSAPAFDVALDFAPREEKAIT